MSILKKINDYFRNCVTNTKVPATPDSTVDSMRLCKDCKYLVLNKHQTYENRLRFAVCSRTAKLNLVGCSPSLHDMNFCFLERDWKNHCGPLAKYFEPYFEPKE